MFCGYEGVEEALYGVGSVECRGSVVGYKIMFSESRVLAKAPGEPQKCRGSVESVEEALAAYFVVTEVSRKRCTVLKVSRSCAMSEVSRKRGRVQDFLF